jgi:hypothetical protein
MDPSKYKPDPVDTSAIELNEDLRANIEALSQNNHEVWAQARTAEGWKYGPARDDARMEHPGLVPYEQLSEAEKEIDRGTVVQTLKAAAALGFDIRRKSVATDASKSKTIAQADDMAEWPPWPEGIAADIVAELEKVREAIGRVYSSANHSAAVNLFWHRIAAPSVALFGTFAVILAILQLYGWKPFSEEGEFIFAITAILVVGVGIAFGFMRKWLVRRHRAERCRFLKFNFLLDLESAGRERDRLLRTARKFRDQANALEEVDYDDMEQWLEEDQVLQDPPTLDENEIVLSDMHVLAEHYLRTRLAVQSRYFLRQANRDMRSNWRFKNVPALFFVASICFAVAHFVIQHYWTQFEHVTPFFMLLAAVLPVAGACIRALRGIGEYSRNTIRFRAKHNALSDLIKDMERALSEQPKALELQSLLWKGEQILEGEHREWLRLMMETEWIG